MWSRNAAFITSNVGGTLVHIRMQVAVRPLSGYMYFPRSRDESLPTCDARALCKPLLLPNLQGLLRTGDEMRSESLRPATTHWTDRAGSISDRADICMPSLAATVLSQREVRRVWAYSVVNRAPSLPVHIHTYTCIPHERRHADAVPCYTTYRPTAEPKANARVAATLLLVARNVAYT